MVSVYLTLITGLSIEQLSGLQDKRGVKINIVGNTALFIAGFALVFIAAGGAAGFIVGAFLQSYTSLLSKIGGALVLLFGLHIAGVFRLGFLHRLHLADRFSLQKKPLGFVGSFIVGIFFAVVCSHCIAPLLYSTLIYAATTGAATLGMQAMASFSLGLAIPYFLLALAFTRVLSYLEKARKYNMVMLSASGLLLAFFGVLMLTDKFSLLTQFFSRLLPYRLPGAM